MARRLGTLALLLVALAACGVGNPAVTPAGQSADIVRRGEVLTGSESTMGAYEITAGRVNAAAHRLPTTVDTAWTAVIAAYQQLGVKNVVAIDERTHTLTARERVRGRFNGDRLSTFFECGASPMGVLADVYQVEFELTTVVTPAPQGGAMVQSNVQARAFNPGGSSRVPVACGSNGTLEARVIGLTRAASVRY